MTNPGRTRKEKLAIASVLLCGAAREYIEADGAPDEDFKRELLETAALNYAIEWDTPVRTGRKRAPSRVRSSQ